MRFSLSLLHLFIVVRRFSEITNVWALVYRLAQESFTIWIQSDRRAYIDGCSLVPFSHSIRISFFVFGEINLNQRNCDKTKKRAKNKCSRIPKPKEPREPGRKNDRSTEKKLKYFCFQIPVLVSSSSFSPSSVNISLYTFRKIIMKSLRSLVPSFSSSSFVFFFIANGVKCAVRRWPTWHAYGYICSLYSSALVVCFKRNENGKQIMCWCVCVK